MKSVFRGIAWSAVDRLGFQLIQLIILVILSRLLQPSDFGLIAIVTFFTSVGNALIDSGFTAALIQKLNISEKEYNTAFIFNIVVAITVYFIFFMSAPLIASFYNEPNVVAITRTICLINLFSSLGIVHLARLHREINFKAIAQINLSAAIFSGAIAVIMAITGFGIWSLVVQTILFYFVQMILLWAFDKWRPKLEFDRISFVQLFNYGYKLLGASLLEIAFQNLYIVIIGKKFSQYTLGIFSQSRRFADVPANTASSIVQQVIFPVFTKIQQDDEQIRFRFSQSLRLLSFSIFPAMFFLAVVSKSLVLIFLTEKWSDAIPYLQVFFITNMLLCIHVANLNILKIKGRSDLYLKAEFFKKIIGLTAIVIALPFGIKGLMLSWVLTYIISYIINAWYCNRLINYSLIKQVKDMLPSFIATVISGGMVFFIIDFQFNNWTNLALELVSCLLIYLIISFVFQIRPFLETIQIIRQNGMKIN